MEGGGGGVSEEKLKVKIIILVITCSVLKQWLVTNWKILASFMSNASCLPAHQATKRKTKTKKTKTKTKTKTNKKQHHGKELNLSVKISCAHFLCGSEKYPYLPMKVFFFFNWILPPSLHFTIILSFGFPLKILIVHRSPSEFQMSILGVGVDISGMAHYTNMTLYHNYWCKFMYTSDVSFSMAGL